VKAVILAAGDGTRLRPYTNDRPKPLVRLLGLTLVERVLLAAKKAGVRDFVVVLGYKGELIRKRLGDGSRYGVRIEYVTNEHWEKGNGSSLLAAEKALRGEKQFLTLMADHIVDPEVIRCALRHASASDDCLLCVDRDLESIVDPDDATKVRTEGGRAVAIGKQIRKYDAVDTGVFVFSPIIFDALRRAQKGGRVGLTDGVREVVKENRLRIVEISGLFWIDVDSLQALLAAEARLLRSLKKKSDGIISRWINRPISTRLTRWLVDFPVSPDFVTMVSFLIAVASGVLFAVGQLLVAGVLAQVASIVDGVDGEIARLKFCETRFGAFVDSLLDRYADVAIVLGMSAWAFQATGHPWILFLGMLVLAGAPLSMLAKEKYRSITGRAYPVDEAEGWMRFVPDSRDARLFIIMLGGITGLIIPTLAILAALTHGKALWRLYRMADLLDVPVVR